ncbi:conserved hypothetical protein [Rubrivivax sp. A210]|nr:conserved hypothetical protein [Rubrivivax sp. A210]
MPKVSPIWWAALAATLLWVVLGDAPEAGAPAELVEPTRPANGGSASPAAAGALAPALQAQGRAPVDPDSGRGLMDKAWAPPPPPAAAPAPPPPPPPAAAPAKAQPPAPPAVPPLQLLGVVKTESPAPQVYFTIADRLVLAHVGDLIDGRFRIDTVNAQKVVVTVLPEQRRIEFTLATVPPGG